MLGKLLYVLFTAVSLARVLWPRGSASTGCELVLWSVSLRDGTESPKSIKSCLSEGCQCTFKRKPPGQAHITKSSEFPRGKGCWQKWRKIEAGDTVLALHGKNLFDFLVWFLWTIKAGFLSVILPSMQREKGCKGQQLIWILNYYFVLSRNS